MALDFTVMMSVRQRFSDSERDDFGLETDAPFVGLRKDYSFNCPDVDSSQSAVIFFQSQGVNIGRPLKINNVTIFGGIRSSVEQTASTGRVVSGSTVLIDQAIIAKWNGNIMLVQNGVLRATNNILQIESDGDNFIIDNVVILFKTRTGVVSPTFDPVTA